MLILKKIRWKNFLSTGNTFTEIQLNKRKTTLISGANGSGKTTLLDALVFGLFGKPYRNINIPQITNSINQKDCIVEIDMEISGVEYKVIRGLSPKLLEIYKQGTLIDQDSKSKDYQKMFEENILKMTHKSFCQVIVLGSTNYVPFMSLTASERREIVEALLDIDIFSTMNALLKVKISENKEDIKEVQHKLDILKERTDAQKNHIKSLKEISKSSIENYNTEITTSMLENENLEVEVSGLSIIIDGLLEKTTDRSKLQSEIIDLNSSNQISESNIGKLNKEITFYKKNDKCPSCSQEISVDLKNQKMKECELHKTDIEAEIRSKDLIISKYEEQIESICKIDKEIKSLQSRVNKIQSDISANNQYVKKINKQILDTLKESGDIDSENDKLNKTIEEGIQSLDEKKKMEEDAQYYTMAAGIMKDSGIKSKIIKYYLPIMNKIINQYLDQMGFFVQFELNESFVETIKSRFRDVFSYASFSEGEKRKIDLALLFAWREIAKLKNSLNCNLLLFDEVLDGSLDDSATESFLNILKLFKKDTNVFVISHKSKEMLQDKFKGHITFVKKNNFSRIEIT